MTEPEENAELRHLVEQLVESDGATPSLWPGLTLYRYSGSVVEGPSRVRSLAVGFVIVGQARLCFADCARLCDEGTYFLLPRGLLFSYEMVEAAPERPFLSMVLHLPPSLVNHVVSAMQRRVRADEGGPPPHDPGNPAVVDPPLRSALIRFVQSLDVEADRNFLGPIYLQEIVFRLLRGQNGHALCQAAWRESAGNPIVAAINHILSDLTRQYSVPELASKVGMSQSAFARQFKETTGESPYRFIKQQRLERACVCLIEEGKSVSDTAMEVGYSSLSHFINEFKRHFGVTPGQYAQRRWSPVAVTLSARSRT
jgi:AraC-like DNA-binding protein